MNIIASIAEQRIAEALEKGEFDRIEGLGKPLVLEDDSAIPQELRMAYKVLKNAGYLPPEAQEIKDAATILEMLQGNVDEQTRYRQMQKLETLLLQIRQRGNRMVAVEMENEYFEKVVSRITIRKQAM